MNGKNRRCKGCFSRGQGRSAAYFRKPARRTPAITLPPNKPAPLYVLPTFNRALIDHLQVGQLRLVNYFETFPFLSIVESYYFNGNTPEAIIHLRQSDFIGGTVRITRPGIYVLQEDIVFEPNSHHDFFPTPNQIISGQYPVGSKGAYHLGFFAAITIETEGVILDLNGHTLQQSKLHNLQQRFYANIELANAPFIASQGPADFTTESIYRAATKVLVCNGTLGLSSHHGIHGNAMKEIFLHKLIISDFEVAGIALNGTTNSILHKITIQRVAQHIPVLSCYSQSRFIRSFLKTLQNRVSHAQLGKLSVDTIIAELNAALDLAKHEFIDQGKIPTNFFGNQTLLYDGNVYGIVLNQNGVVINDFIKERAGENIGNTDIHLQHIQIHNIISHPVEIIALNAPPEEETAYGGKRSVGPIGDVLQIEDVTNELGLYTPTVLSNAQLILAKYNDQINVGTTNIFHECVEWAETGTSITSFVGEGKTYYYVDGGDSMGHFMKGNIGLFISAGKHITGKNIVISNVKIVGNSVRAQQTGAMSTGLLITGSQWLMFINTHINNITSSNGEAHKMQALHSDHVVVDGTALA